MVSLDRQVLTALERVEMAPDQVKNPEEGNHLMIILGKYYGEGQPGYNSGCGNSPRIPLALLPAPSLPQVILPVSIFI